jgi:arylsulfatase A-like enzyme
MGHLPNIVFILADDLGYGDISCLNPDGKIPTPQVDRLAREGMRFTDAHATSAVCTPSRYGILTGRYNWRSPLQAFIVPPYADPLIDRNRLTVAGMLRGNGYHTAAVGKWHLGMGWDFEKTDAFLPANDRFNQVAPERNPLVTEAVREAWNTGFSRPTTGGPTTRGFDSYFGVDVPNWPPYCFIEDDRTVGVPSEYLPTRLLGDLQASNPGPAMPYWHFEQLLPSWADRSDSVIGEAAARNQPFFLYLALTSPHTPLSVNARWQGASGLNSRYADLVMETDDIVGRVMESLERHGVSDNTMVIFTSDNGFAHYAGSEHLESRGHYPSDHFRGYKSDAWDGGHRVPLIVRWPGVINAGSESPALVSLADWMATFAEIAETELPPDAAEDSLSLLPLLHDPDASSPHDYVIHHSIYGKFAIRDSRWKLVLCPGSGGWTLPDQEALDRGLPMVQLYDMENDPAEQTNRFSEHPETVKRMRSALEAAVARGRTTPGPDQENDVPVDIWKLSALSNVPASAIDDY